MRRHKDYQDKLKGMLTGLAVGDMLGAPVEFKDPSEFEPITEPIEGGSFNLPKGYWTDDTSMALCLADSLLALSGYNSYDVMNRYWLWCSTGYRSSTGKCFDIGSQTSFEINNYMRTGGFVKADTPRISNAGNGAIVRLAPVIIAAYRHRKPEDILRMARVSARETHYSYEAELATEVFASLLLRVIESKDKSKICKQRKQNPFLRFISFDDEIEINGEPPAFFSYFKIYDKIIHAIDFDKSTLNTNGYIIHSLQVAVWAFKNYDNFKDGALAVVNLGGDADTNCAIYGQLAGAYYGHTGIPYKWRRTLFQESAISSLADKLIGMASCPMLLTRFEEDYLNKHL
jgi:ADP-ribosyl-[dinitrogen reductase] hydrolase